MPPMLWQARTVKHILVDVYQMDAGENPTVHCACGRSVHADVCVDITPLPIGIRKTLGLHLVDYLCDGCQTRLFRELHIAEEEFYSLLGAPEEALIFHRERDPLHEIGCDLRPEAFKPRHSRVSKAEMVGKKLGEVAVVAPIPLSRNRKSHRDAALSVHRDPHNEISLAAFDTAIAMPPAQGVSLPIETPGIGSARAADLGDVGVSTAIDDLPADEPAVITEGDGPAS